MFDFKSFQKLTMDFSGYNIKLFVFVEDLDDIVNCVKEKWHKGFEEYRNGDVIKFAYRSDYRDRQLYFFHEVFKNAVQFNHMM